MKITKFEFGCVSQVGVTFPHTWGTRIEVLGPQWVSFRPAVLFFFSLPMYCVSPLGLLEFLHPEYEGSNKSIHPCVNCHVVWSVSFKKMGEKKHSGTAKRRYSFNIEHTVGHTISFQVLHKNSWHPWH